ncbi:50S ribosomal protein L30 [Rickettsia prowazekii]|uniref:Large ribosomal subunit protein uL30 n=2 Tax=Rickettsia prowazekii TaxID=782 RepID=RL30_RICPR|nr:50S ribosomal protein L30 [Rickettsia prowazekii]Q9ZCS3.1 RecName: Full=Large ribosomal subunit protein uL30; AltName: Full=50S ribosomal protein L30 [Rickettsia prowazekii str. Madrid E]EOB10631.1 30S ribosomal protein S5 [Rickettsia prowazekii str. GvF12]ADE30184.1 50S ribosomal protein L30 [Rickettsia prowazekii str. Rp22]AFE49441.1 50S ribosomal protein L30 [Rickettsia prowazekii str. Chernikova]AFE50285.1 50S ribosomal protein L30 [Rickettsia prowazekii str. Katsinyian]AFE51131.1 50S 
MNNKINNIKITQIKSAIGCKYDQRFTLIGLGLNKINKSVILKNTNSIRGMVEKVKHLLKIENM